MRMQPSILRNRLCVSLSLGMALAFSTSARASTAYGTLNNFDCVNDVVVNGAPVECHGFEIEFEDLHSADISYTYDYNHYGVPTISEDSADPAHPKVRIRWAAKKNPGGSWTAYTAIPSGPISPTDGHQFTNPSVNFGGEHFGVGYNRAPTAVRSFWLYDDGTGNLTRGPLVNIGMPTFVYYPAVAQVQPILVPPAPPVPPVQLRFGDSSWIKDIKTTTHNANKVELNDLVDPDPDDPDAHDWTNGEPAEVETEWRLLQTEFAQPDNPDPANANGELAGQPEELPDGNEVITRRYEFYKYTGPFDAESGEAMASEVGPDGIHGVGSVTYNDHFDPMTGEWVEVTVDLSTVEVVGEFFGAQMSAFDVAPALGLIDHVPDGELGVPYADRTVVVAGGAAFLASVSGALPDGTSFDVLTGVFSGTPTAPGVFVFTINVSDTTGALVTKSYTVTIPEAAPDTSTIATSPSPLDGGTTTGDGVYANGTPVIVVASHNPGYAFINWTEGGVEVSVLPNYPFTVSADRELVANFTPTFTLTTSASPDDGGVTGGDGVYNDGTSVTALATEHPGFAFVNWTENEATVSVSASYTFILTADRTLVAHFAVVGCGTDADCADEDACTFDACVAHSCQNSPVAGCCNANAECDDGNACTRDACANHQCLFDDIPGCCTADAQCVDADDCTLDTCENFACRHTPVQACCLTYTDCDDGDNCTVDDCVQHVCLHQPTPGCCHTGAECEDGDVCTVDACVNQACVHDPLAGCCHAAAECDDANPCTMDMCVQNVCAYSDITDCCRTDAHCDDGDACTMDRCENAACVHDAIPGCCRTNADCDDGDNCTSDACDVAAATCTHAVLDSDGDHVCDADDSCPQSDLDATIVIGTCDTGVANQLLDNGCTMSDQIEACQQSAFVHGMFARCVAHLAGDWRSAGLITGGEKGKIQSCVIGKMNTHAQRKF